MIEWLWTGFGLVIWFIELLNSSWLHVIDHYHTQTRVLSRGLHWFYWQLLPTVGVLLFPGSRTSRLAAISCQTPTRLTAVQGLFRNDSWPSLYSLGTDRTENIASNSSSIVACMSVAAFMWRLLSHYLATGVFMKPFLATVVSVGFTILAFSRHATLFMFENWYSRRTSHMTSRVECWRSICICVPTRRRQDTILKKGTTSSELNFVDGLET
jgi:hypothetical protein